MSNQKNISQQTLMETLQMAECIVTKQEVNIAYDELAAKINVDFVGKNPLIIIVMKGGIITAGQLMQRLSFFHRMDYLHATRYQDNQAKHLKWLTFPEQSVTDEHVLLIDDIFDEGTTLKEIVMELKKDAPKSIKTCVLLNKKHNRKVKDFRPDFVGLHIEDVYVFGCGMDYHGYLRHLAGIFAVKHNPV